MANPTWDDVEEIIEEPTMEQDVPSWDDVDEVIEDSDPVSEPPTKKEAFGRGALQGATLGFGDEIAGAVGTAGSAIKRAYDSVMADERFDSSKMEEYKSLSPDQVDAMLAKDGFQGDVEFKPLEKYQELRDRTREADSAAKEEHGKTYMAGELAGSIAPAVMTGGAGAMANAGKLGLKGTMHALGKAGAKYGAGYAAGTSEADIVEDIQEDKLDQTGELLGDVAEGAAGGYVMGGALGGAGAGIKAAAPYIKKAVKPSVDATKKLLTNLAQAISSKKSKVISESYKQAKKGNGFITENSAIAADRNLDKATAQAIGDVQKVRTNLNEKLSTTLKTAKELDVTDDFAKAAKELERLSENYAADTDIGKIARTISGSLKSAEQNGNKVDLINYATGEKTKRTFVNPKYLFELYKSGKDSLYKGGLSHQEKEFLPIFEMLETNMKKNISDTARKRIEESMGGLTKAHDVMDFIRYQGDDITDTAWRKIRQSSKGKIAGATKNTELTGKLSDIKRVGEKETFKKDMMKLMGETGKDNLRNLEEKSTLKQLAMLTRDEVERSGDKITSLGGVAPTLTAMMSKLAAGAGKAARAIEKGGSLIGELSKLDAKVYAQLSQKAKSPTMRRSLEGLSKAGENKKKALLFTMSQRPEFRSEIYKLLGVKDKDK